MDSKSELSVASSTLKHRLLHLCNQLPEKDSSIQPSIKTLLLDQIASLKEVITIISDNNHIFKVVEYEESLAKDIHGHRQPEHVVSRVGHLLNNCCVFSEIFKRKNLKIEYDSNNEFGYAPANTSHGDQSRIT